MAKIDEAWEKFEAWRPPLPKRLSGFDALIAEFSESFFKAGYIAALHDALAAGDTIDDMAVKCAASMQAHAAVFKARAK